MTVADQTAVLAGMRIELQGIFDLLPKVAQAAGRTSDTLAQLQRRGDLPTAGLETPAAVRRAITGGDDTFTARAPLPGGFGGIRMRTALGAPGGPAGGIQGILSKPVGELTENEWQRLMRDAGDMAPTVSRYGQDVALTPAFFANLVNQAVKGILSARNAIDRTQAQIDRKKLEDLFNRFFGQKATGSTFDKLFRQAMEQMRAEMSKQMTRMNQGRPDPLTSWRAGGL
jgi:hypothetical protein